MNNVKIIHDTSYNSADSVNGKIFINGVEIKGVKSINMNLEVDFMFYEFELQINEPIGGTHTLALFKILDGPNVDMEQAIRDGMLLTLLNFEGHLEVYRDVERPTWKEVFKK